MEEFQIRRAGYEDVPKIMNIIDIAVDNLTNKNMFFADSEDFIAEHIEKRGFALVAEAKDTIAGYIVVRFPKDDDDNLGKHVKKAIDLNKVAHMESTAVLPEYRNRGIQTKLLISAEEKLKETEYCYYMGTVDPDNTICKKTVLSRDYVIIDRVKKYGSLTRDIMFKKV